MRQVYVAGVGMTRFAKQPARSLKSLIAEAVSLTLGDAGIDVSQVQSCYFGNAVAGSITGQEMIAGQVSLRPLGIDRIPIYNVENACASASTAFHLAWQAVACGLHDVVLAIGAEKLSHPDKARAFDAIARAADVEDAPLWSTRGRSPFMDIYASEARSYMEASGATPRDFAAVVVKNQRNGSLNPAAQYGAKLTVDEVLAAREIIAPLTLLMCSPISDGAAAALLVSRGAARQLGRLVRVAASVVTSGAARGPGSVKCTSEAARQAYELASVGPQDVSCAEVHDAAAPAELEIYEQLGFCATGEGPRMIRQGETLLGGIRPVNTSGGLLARGHPIGATGLAQIYEAVLQLRSEAGSRQVPGARLALTQNAGGWLDGDNAACVVHLLQAP